MNDDLTYEQMVEKFQCPGCVAGSDMECGAYKAGYHGCDGHVTGTHILGIGCFALGLPKGFNRPGWLKGRHNNQMNIRLWVSPEEHGAECGWDKLNVPVWAMEKDGFLFVRTYSPRINETNVDVVQGGTLALCPDAIDVGEFADEID